MGYHADDGHKYYGGNDGAPYGPTFGTDDVVGACINLRKREVFFTCADFHNHDTSSSMYKHHKPLPFMHRRLLLKSLDIGNPTGKTASTWVSRFETFLPYPSSQLWGSTVSTPAAC